MSKGFNPGQARDDRGRWTTSGVYALFMTAKQKIEAAAIAVDKFL